MRIYELDRDGKRTGKSQTVPKLQWERMLKQPKLRWTDKPEKKEIKKDEGE